VGKNCRILLFEYFLSKRRYNRYNVDSQRVKVQHEPPHVALVAGLGTEVWLNLTMAVLSTVPKAGRGVFLLSRQVFAAITGCMAGITYPKSAPSGGGLNFEAQLWASADKMRGSMELLSEYKYATEQSIAEEEALKKGMEENSREFAEQGSELYAKA